jgi:hypothetical protein
MRSSALRLFLFLGLLARVISVGQTVHEVVPVAQPSGSYIAFKFDWPQGHPWVNYTISVDDAGSTHFEGVGNSADSGDSDTFKLDFAMTDACRQKIFNLAKQTDYFRGTFETKQKNIAHTGEKTLEYHGRPPNGDKTLATSATYNFSPNPDVQELTRIFLSIATTVDFGRKLAFDYRFDKIGLDARLHSLQEMQADHFIEELQAIEPILQKIANDPNVMHINRVTAKQLLKSISPTVPVAQPATQP